MFAVKNKLNPSGLKSGFILIFFIILSLVLFLNRNSEWLRAASGLIQKIFSSPKTTLYKIKTGLYSVNLNSTEVKKLQQENKLLIEKQADYQKLLNDNIALKSQFENPITKSRDLLSVPVAGFSGSFDNPTGLVISAGQKDKLLPGMPVISGDSLVGIVKSVSGNFSQITLPNNEDFKLVGKTLFAGARGIISGKTDFILFDHVLITDSLSQNDVVVTAGRVENGVEIPAFLVVGKVAAVSKNENQPFQSSQIKSLLDYKKLNTVFVIREKQP